MNALRSSRPSSTTSSSSSPCRNPAPSWRASTAMRALGSMDTFRAIGRREKKMNRREGKKRGKKRVCLDFFFFFPDLLLPSDPLSRPTVPCSRPSRAHSLTYFDFHSIVFFFETDFFLFSECILFLNKKYKSIASLLLLFLSNIIVKRCPPCAASSSASCSSSSAAASKT